MNSPNPLANFFEGDDNASHLEYWSGFLFVEKVGKKAEHLSSDELRNEAHQCIRAASVFLGELNDFQKPDTTDES
jgi:hypothetical protein